MVVLSFCVFYLFRFRGVSLMVCEVLFVVFLSGVLLVFWL